VTSDRWVCRRCFESNDASLPSCGKCGLLRGSEPPANDPTYQPPLVAPRSGLRRFAVRYAFIGIIVLVAVGGWVLSAKRDENGQIANGGNLNVNDLRPGDCFDLKDPTASSVDEVTAKPCTQAHEYEAFYVGAMPSGDFPSDAVINAWVSDNCLPAFEAYVGISYDKSELLVYPIVPTANTWSNDRTVECVVQHPRIHALTQSLRGYGK
jgi:hypothetical protein